MAMLTQTVFFAGTVNGSRQDQCIMTGSDSPSAGVLLAGTYILTFSTTPQAASLKAGQADPYAESNSTKKTALEFVVSVSWVGCNGNDKTYKLSAVFRSCTVSGEPCKVNACWWTNLLPHVTAQFQQKPDGEVDQASIEAAWSMGAANGTSNGDVADVEVWATALCPHEVEARTMSEQMLHTISSVLEVK